MTPDSLQAYCLAQCLDEYTLTYTIEYALPPVRRASSGAGGRWVAVRQDDAEPHSGVQVGLAWQPLPPVCQCVCEWVNM